MVHDFYILWCSSSVTNHHLQNWVVCYAKERGEKKAKKYSIDFHHRKWASQITALQNAAAFTATGGKHPCRNRESKLIAKTCYFFKSCKANLANLVPSTWDIL